MLELLAHNGRAFRSPVAGGGSGVMLSKPGAVCSGPWGMHRAIPEQHMRVGLL